MWNSKVVKGFLVCEAEQYRKITITGEEGRTEFMQGASLCLLAEKEEETTGVVSLHDFQEQNNILRMKIRFK